MKKRVMVIIAAVAVVFTVSACQSPRVYCFNEPTIGPDGRAVNHIECVSTAYSGR